MTTPDFLDRLVNIFQSAIACVQENAQLKAENAQLKTANTDLQTKLDTVTSSLNADEQIIAERETKLAGLEQLVQQYETVSNGTAQAPTPIAV